MLIMQQIAAFELVHKNKRQSHPWKIETKEMRNFFLTFLLFEKYVNIVNFHTTVLSIFQIFFNWYNTILLKFWHINMKKTYFFIIDCKFDQNGFLIAIYKAKHKIMTNFLTSPKWSKNFDSNAVSLMTKMFVLEKLIFKRGVASWF